MKNKSPELVVMPTSQFVKDYIEHMATQGYRVDHIAKCCGYISRKVGGILKEYNGKYGTGFVIHTPRFDQTGYHDVMYLIKHDSNSENC